MYFYFQFSVQGRKYTELDNLGRRSPEGGADYTAFGGMTIKGEGFLCDGGDSGLEIALKGQESERSAFPYPMGQGLCAGSRGHRRRKYPEKPKIT